MYGNEKLWDCGIDPNQTSLGIHVWSAKRVLEVGELRTSRVSARWSIKGAGFRV